MSPQLARRFNDPRDLRLAYVMNLWVSIWGNYGWGNNCVLSVSLGAFATCCSWNLETDMKGRKVSIPTFTRQAKDLE